MVIRNVSQGNAELSALLEMVPQGEDVVIAKAGNPVARLVPCRASERPRTPGAPRGLIHIHQDFDELPQDVARAFALTDE